MSRPPRLHLAAASLALVLGACVDTEVTTSPYAHESPPLPPPPLQNLVRGAFLGGSGTDHIDDMAIAPDGTIYVVGGTNSPDFPTTDGSTLDATTPANCSACPFDAFVAAFAPGGAPRWVRLIQSPGYDRLTSIRVVGSTVYVGGATGERAGAAGWHGGADAAGVLGDQDGLVCSLSATDGAIGACRYLGGNGPGGVSELAVNPSGTRVVAAMITTAAEALHLDPAYPGAFAGTSRETPAADDLVVFSLTTNFAAADNVEWATFLGGTGDERGTPSVQVAGFGTDEVIYALTETASTDAPTTSGMVTAPPPDGQGAYLALLAAGTGALRNAGYLGGSGDDRVSPHSIVDAGFYVFVAITTTSTDIPAGGKTGHQRDHGGNGGPGCGDGDVWLGRYTITAGGLAGPGVTSYLGGVNGERLGGLSQSRETLGQGAVMVTGSTSSPAFPVRDAAQPLYGSPACATSPGTADAFVANLDWLFEPQDATFLGGLAFERGTSIAMPHGGLVVVAGDTESSNFPVRGAGDLTANGGVDGFIAAYGLEPGMPPVDGGPGLDGSAGGLDAFFEDDAGGNPAYTEDGAACVCSTGGGAPPAAGLGLAGLVMVLVTRRRRR